MALSKCLTATLRATRNLEIRATVCRWCAPLDTTPPTGAPLWRLVHPLGPPCLRGAMCCHVMVFFLYFAQFLLFFFFVLCSFLFCLFLSHTLSLLLLCMRTLFCDCLSVAGIICTPTEVPNSNLSTSNSVSGNYPSVYAVACDDGYSGDGDAVCGTDGIYTVPTCAGHCCCVQARGSILDLRM